MDRQLRVLCLYLAAAVCCQGSLAAAAAAPATAMSGIGEIEDASQVVRMMGATDAVKEYLSDPTTVCTGFLPTNQALIYSTQQLGRYSARLAQNETRVGMLLNYHIIPDVALTSAQLKDGMKLTTRQGEPLHILVKDNKTYIYSNPKFPAALVKLDIPAGRCMVHTVERVMPPPSWAAEMEELQARAAADKAAQAAGGDATASTAAAPAAAAAAASPAPGRSGAGAVVATSAVMVGAAAAAVVAFAL